MDSSNWRDQLQHNEKLFNFVEESVKLCCPDSVYLCSGSESENKRLLQIQIDNGLMIKLNEEKRPNSYLVRSDPDDVARLENCTFICSKKKEEAPTGSWREPTEMKQTLNKLFDNCMKGRTMYIIPFAMGPFGSHITKYGVQITDSEYVATNMRIMTRMGQRALDAIGSSDEFVPCLHSVGKPLGEGEHDNGEWPSNSTKYICHFPDEYKVMSFGSGYGGNALLNKKCFALRIASKMARDQGWLAEHMLVLGLTNPQGEKKYICGAFPSQCGKTATSMLQSKLPGWKVTTVGDDICWMKYGQSTGKLMAVNCENGFFGVAPGTSEKSSPNGMGSIRENTIFTNVALTEDGDVWWEGMTDEVPPNLTDWRGNKYDPSSGRKAAHPNSRFTAPIAQCPSVDPAYDDPEGVPVSAILFGGRRSEIVPLVYESFDWVHGTMLGASLRSEKTTAASDVSEKIRSDPFAMLPFFGYNVGDYFQHWLDVGNNAQSPDLLPKIFFVNWFRKDSEGKFLWPGFSDNIRVLKWIFERCANPDSMDNMLRTPIGILPKHLDLQNLDVSLDTMKQLFEVKSDEWLAELDQVRETLLQKGGDRCPKALLDKVNAIQRELKGE